MEKPRILVFASGSAGGGGSGFENLVNAKRNGTLSARIVGVVSNHGGGGVRERAERLDIPFHHLPHPDRGGYADAARRFGASWFALSGWLKKVEGLPPERTFNIHPGPLPRFGGKGMYGHHVHEAVMAAYRAGEIAESAVTMHFVTEGYDEGPAFFRLPVRIDDADTPETLAGRVNALEHQWQPYVTDLVVHGDIRWDGKDPASLVTLADLMR